MIIVADASPLVALAVCDCLHVLPILFSELVVSQTVYTEVTVTDKPGATTLKAFLQGKVYPLDLGKFIIGAGILDEGELTSIALYKQLQADFLLMDEKTGRRLAKLNHIQVIGSLGVLIEARKKGIIPALKPPIETLRQAGIFFSDTLLNYALQQDYNKN